MYYTDSYYTQYEEEKFKFLNYNEVSDVKKNKINTNVEIYTKDQIDSMRMYMQTEKRYKKQYDYLMNGIFDPKYNIK